MKTFPKPLKTISITAFVLVLLVGLGSMSETSAKNEKGSKFERQLLKKLDHLLELLSPHDPEESSGENPSLQEANYNSERRSCVDNYTVWPTSNTKKANVDWNLEFIPFENYYDQGGKRREQFLDLNGDGVLDYLYAHKYNNSAYSIAEECVYLGTGSGWNKAYECRSQERRYSSEPVTYYGDCAQL